MKIFFGSFKNLYGKQAFNTTKKVSKNLKKTFQLIFRQFSTAHLQKSC